MIIGYFNNLGLGFHAKGFDQHAFAEKLSRLYRNDDFIVTSAQFPTKASFDLFNRAFPHIPVIIIPSWQCDGDYEGPDAEDIAQRDALIAMFGKHIWHFYDFEIAQIEGVSFRYKMIEI